FHLRKLWRSPLPRAITAHIVFAFMNALGAATMGAVIGFDKTYHFLPGYVMANVFAHAHLAAIGCGRRRLSAAADDPACGNAQGLASLAQRGPAPNRHFRLFVTLLFRSRFTSLFASTVVAGLAAFLAQVVWASA